MEFDDDEWGGISDEAKDLISKMLCKDPEKRIKINLALNHKWFKKWKSCDPETHEFQTEYLKRLKSYRAPTKLQHEVLSFLTRNLDTSERIKIKDVFRNITSKSSGDLTFADLEEAFNETGIEGATEHIEELKKCLNFDKDGKIKYTDFLVATINKNEALTDANIKFAFHHFDTNNDGFIVVDDLIEVFHREGRGLTKEEVEEMLKQADISRTGKIDLDDFSKLIKMDYPRHHDMTE